MAKSSRSYIEMIATAILSSPERRLVLGEIYDHIAARLPTYFRSTATTTMKAHGGGGQRESNWKNSVRHNLSLNACFVKSRPSSAGVRGGSDSGGRNRGSFWSVHPACVEEFSRGNFRRRLARKRISRRTAVGAYNVRGEPTPPLCGSTSGYVAMTCADDYSTVSTMFDGGDRQRQLWTRTPTDGREIIDRYHEQLFKNGSQWVEGFVDHGRDRCAERSDQGLDQPWPLEHLAAACYPSTSVSNTVELIIPRATTASERGLDRVRTLPEFGADNEAALRAWQHRTINHAYGTMTVSAPWH